MLDNYLQAQIQSLERQGLLREPISGEPDPLRPIIIRDGRRLITFASNDYLGLKNHPLIKKAACKAIMKYGVGSGAARLMSGSFAVHHQAEEAIAEFTQAQKAILFSTGYSANIAAITALMKDGGTVLLDRLCHASLIDAARLCKANLRLFHHNDLDHLEHQLRRLRLKSKEPVLIVTESIFSMDGDRAPLHQLVELKERFGAWLLVDEAHATGLFGERGLGLAQIEGVHQHIEVRIVTFGKAIGVMGGAICGSSTLIRYLYNTARPWIFTTAPAPAIAAAIQAAIQLLSTKECQERRNRLWQLVSQLTHDLRARFNPGCQPTIGPFSEAWGQSPIFPIVLGSNDSALAVSRQLFEHGILAPAIRFPTVPKGKERLRISITAMHDQTMVRNLVDTLATILPITIYGKV